MNKIEKLNRLLGEFRELYSRILRVQHEFITISEEVMIAFKETSPRQSAAAIRLLGSVDKDADLARVDRIIAFVAESYRVNPEDLLAKIRGRDFDDARSLAMLIAFERTQLLHGDLAQVFRRERSNISICMGNTKRRLASDPSFYRRYLKLMSGLEPVRDAKAS